jgi:hypothetical protein
MLCAQMGNMRKAGARPATTAKATQIAFGTVVTLTLLGGLWSMSNREAVSASAPHLEGTGPANYVTGQPAAARPPGNSLDCGPDWSVVQSPGLGNTLDGIAAISSNDAWAAGYYAGGGLSQYLIEHWDGAQWSVVPGPNLGTSNNGLNGIAAISSSNVWAVGYNQPGSVLQTLILHWDGTQWSIVPSPNVGAASNQLYAIGAVSASDIWAVGTSNSPTFHTLALHWDGSTWNVVASPNPDTYNELFGITVVSSNDVWAVGEHRQVSMPTALVEHWDGAQWNVVPAPNPGTNIYQLNALAALSSSDVWAVGFYRNIQIFTLIEHWDGTQWSAVPSPNGGSTDNQLNGIAAVASNDIWAVGYYYSGPSPRTLILHWDGSAWSIVSSPSPAVYDDLYGVAAVSAKDAWAVGYNNDGSSFRPLVERYNPCPGSPTPTTATPTPVSTATRMVIATPTAVTTSVSTLTPTATATGTAVSPTATLTQAPASPTRTSKPAPSPSAGIPSAVPTSISTPIPTATPEPCAISFSDVHPTDYFYQAVLYLACNGVISGYPDHTFLPNNNATRGQMTKIVVLGFGVHIDTAGGPHFSDVLPGSPFYAYVETAYHEHIVSGYGDRTFRSFNNVTRGQLAKIVVQTGVAVKGWTLANPPNATFVDVPPGSTFYTYIETAAGKGLVSGYPDHAFRPAHNATRGQIAKINYLAISTPLHFGVPSR